MAPKVTISLLTDSCQLKCTAKHPSVTDDNSINIEWIRNGETIPTNDGIVTIDNAGGRYNCSASFGGITQEETYYTEGKELLINVYPNVMYMGIYVWFMHSAIC